MDIKEGIKLKGRPVTISDCSRDDLPKFFKEMGFKVGAEIGIHRGEFIEKFCKEGLRMYAIDPWEESDDYTRNQARLDKVYDHAKKRLSKYDDCMIIRKDSMEAVLDLPDECLDFVYIDGNHHFKYVAEDLVEWSKKVKSGGVICGHDFVYTRGRNNLAVCHVPFVLLAYLDAYRIKNWYVLGDKDQKPGEKRDRWRSWMFFKE